jgi:hypothetical protein
MRWRDWESPGGFIVREFCCDNCSLIWQMIIRPAFCLYNHQRCCNCGSEATVPEEAEPPFDRDFAF